MAQATGILTFKSVGKLEPGELYYFAAIDGARFKRPVLPGTKWFGRLNSLKNAVALHALKGVAKVDGEIACEAEMMYAAAVRSGL